MVLHQLAQLAVIDRAHQPAREGAAVRADLLRVARRSQPLGEAARELELGQAWPERVLDQEVFGDEAAEVLADLDELSAAAD